MAFGFSPKIKQELIIEGFSSQQLLALAVDAIKSLNWKVSSTNHEVIVAYTLSSWASWNEEITVSIQTGKIDIKSECIGNQLFDWGKNRKNVESLIFKIQYLRDKTSIEQLDNNYFDLVKNISTDQVDLLNQPSKSSKDRIDGFFSIFIPREGFYITPILIDINLLVFFLMVIKGAGFLIPNSQVLLSWGANFKPLTLNGQWWRLFTCIFLHAGIFHLLMNMYALLYIGLMLEPYLGKIRFLSLYILTGIAASTTSLWWHEYTVSIGASGPIFGMYGLFLAMLTTNLIEKNARKAFLISISVFVAYNLLNGTKDNIDNAAHIGGLISGILLGYGIYFSLKESDDLELEIKTVGLSAFILIGLCTIIYSFIPNTLEIYDTRIKDFAKLEADALEYYPFPEYADSAFRIHALEQGIDNWQKCIKIFDAIDKMDLPPVIVDRDYKLREYINLRLETYRMIKEGVLRDSLDNVQLQIKNNKIDIIIQELKNN
jgi:rhomboid protease GluP